MVKGELKRDIIDYRELEGLTSDDVLNLQDKINTKLDEIEDSIRDIIKLVMVLTQKEACRCLIEICHQKKLESMVLKIDYLKAVIYKMLEKYHYLKFYKKCKKILDDGKVSDKEIDDLEMHELEERTLHLHLVDLIHQQLVTKNLLIKLQVFVLMITEFI